MRTACTFLALATPLLALACSTDRVSGPAARAAYAQARTNFPVPGEGVLVFVDGERVLPPGLERVDPSRFRSIEIVKGAAAERLYGAEAKRGAIFIVTAP